MKEMIKVSFKEKGKSYYFNTNDIELKKDLTVIVKTEKGLQFGKTTSNPEKFNENILKSELKPVIRIATKSDYDENKKNNSDALIALKKCKELVVKNELKMQIVDCMYTFDRDQLIFRFLADSRIDFRNLAKELASIYKTRIELRQIGVRDKAKEIGGIGPCGRCFCCNKFLTDFDSVSISMAKDQNLALNPSKINGVCGRLLCCLKYEDENYKECRKCLPALGSKIVISEGEGKVVSIN
ncbi:MAG: regulatory iron-sulfur-containing complex subunit RicT [Bacilli bacterium]